MERIGLSAERKKSQIVFYFLFNGIITLVAIMMWFVTGAGLGEGGWSSSTLKSLFSITPFVYIGVCLYSTLKFSDSKKSPFKLRCLYFLLPSISLLSMIFILNFLH